MNERKNTERQLEIFPGTNEKSGHPTQPGNRSGVTNPTNRKKRSSILYQIRRFFKRVRWERVAAAVLAVCAMIWLHSLTNRGTDVAPETEPAEGEIYVQTQETETEAPETQLETEPETQIEYIFRDGEGFPVDVQSMASTWAAEAGIEKRYDLTDAERWEIASVVTAEAGGEPYAGKMAVAQCILQACEDDGIRPTEAVVKYSYAKGRPEPSKEALEAVAAVFDLGQVVTNEPIKYFYAPKRCTSEFHESQEYVMTINNHKFFAEVS